MPPPVNFTHGEPIASAPPVSLVSDPPQVLVVVVFCKTSPDGNVSVMVIPVSPNVLAPGLVIVKVSEVDPFSETWETTNALLIVGGAATFIVAVLLVVPVPPSFEVMTLVILLGVPATVPFTVAAIVHGVPT